jgi:hypothetical protein
MSDKPISDLRRRMIADMTIRTFSDKTQRDYIRHVEAFASFLGRSPDTATTNADINKQHWASGRATMRHIGVSFLPRQHGLRPSTNMAH